MLCKQACVRCVRTCRPSGLVFSNASNRAASTSGATATSALHIGQQENVASSSGVQLPQKSAPQLKHWPQPTPSTVAVSSLSKQIGQPLSTTSASTAAPAPAAPPPLARISSRRDGLLDVRRQQKHASKKKAWSQMCGFSCMFAARKQCKGAAYRTGSGWCAATRGQRAFTLAFRPSHLTQLLP